MQILLPLLHSTQEHRAETGHVTWRRSYDNDIVIIGTLSAELGSCYLIAISALCRANGGKSVSLQSHFGYLTDFDESILLTILTTVTLLTRAANDPSVFTITEKAPTIGPFLVESAY